MGELPALRLALHERDVVTIILDIVKPLKDDIAEIAAATGRVVRCDVALGPDPAWAENDRGNGTATSPLRDTVVSIELAA